MRSRKGIKSWNIVTPVIVGKGKEEQDQEAMEIELERCLLCPPFPSCAVPGTPVFILFLCCSFRDLFFCHWFLREKVLRFRGVFFSLIFSSFY